MPKRNWQAICNLSDKYTRIAISLATDPEILACYQRGFPQCFLNDDEEEVLLIPLSALVAAAREASLEEYRGDPSVYDYADNDQHFDLSNGWSLYPHLTIPIAFKCPCAFDEPVDLPMQESLRSQFRGQVYQAGMTLTTEAGHRYMVLDCHFPYRRKEPGGKYKELLAIGEPIENIPSTDFSLVDASFVALDK